MPHAFTLKVTLPATPERVFKAWMSSEEHTAMTGGVAHVTPEVGANFDAWDGYIRGRTLELEPGRRILQTWRTLHFGADDPDSQIEVLLKPDGGAMILTLKHSQVPDGQTSYQESGWRLYYFEPMKRRFQWLRLQASMANRSRPE